MQHQDGTSAHPEFYYDPKSQRYRYGDTKRFAPRTAIQALRKKYVREIEKQAIADFDTVLAGKKRFLDWQLDFLQQVKTLHVQQTIIGRGGIDRVTTRDWLEVANNLRLVHYPRFRDFAQDLKLGKLSERQAKARLKLYLRSSRVAYSRAAKTAAQDGGAVYGKRVRHALDSCPECILYSSWGIKPLSTLPNIGEACTCRANCTCSLEVYGSLEDAIRGVARSYIA